MTSASFPASFLSARGSSVPLIATGTEEPTDMASMWAAPPDLWINLRCNTSLSRAYSPRSIVFSLRNLLYPNFPTCCHFPSLKIETSKKPVDCGLPEGSELSGDNPATTDTVNRIKDSKLTAIENFIFFTARGSLSEVHLSCSRIRNCTL